MDDRLVTQLLHRAAIEELAARYNRTFDDMDVERWCDTFTEEGAMSLNGREWRGRDALQRLAERIGFGMVHVTTNAVVTITGDEAVQECSLVLFRRSLERAPVELLTTGRYADRLIRTTAGWRFSYRAAATDSPL